MLNQPKDAALSVRFLFWWHLSEFSFTSQRKSSCRQRCSAPQRCYSLHSMCDEQTSRTSWGFSLGQKMGSVSCMTHSLGTNTVSDFPLFRFSFWFTLSSDHRRLSNFLYIYILNHSLWTRGSGALDTIAKASFLLSQVLSCFQNCAALPLLMLFFQPHYQKIK